MPALSRLLLAVGLGAVLSGLLVWSCGRPDPEPIPQAVRDSLASYRADAVRDSLTRDSLMRAADAAIARADEERARASAAESSRRAAEGRANREASRSSALADSARGAATARDSATLWQRAYTSKTVVSSELRDALSAADTVIAVKTSEALALREGIAALSARAENAETRLARADALILELERAANRAGHRSLWGKLKDRTGVVAGYGLTASRDGTVRHGFTVAAGIRVFP